MPTDIEKRGRFLNKFAGAKTHPRWPDAVKLLNAGKEEEAAVIARQILQSTPQLKFRNKTSVSKRRLRISQLEAIDDMDEKVVQPLFVKLQKQTVGVVMRAAGRDGTIPMRKLNPVLKAIRLAVYDVYRDLRVALGAAVRQSIKRGIAHDMRSAQDGLDQAQGKNESDIDYAKRCLLAHENRVEIEIDKPLFTEAAPKKAEISVTGTLFHRVFDSVKKARIQRGLFKSRTRGTAVFQSGFPLSEQVWDLRNETLRKMRHRVASGVASGEAASTIAADLKRYTKISKLTSADIAALRKSGFTLPRGSYWSSYSNAMRMVRTEMNVAYVDAELEYARRKGYKKQWNISWPDACPLCTPLDGKIFEPQDVPFPQHPNDACYLTTIIPDVTDEPKGGFVDITIPLSILLALKSIKKKPIKQNNDDEQ